MLAPTAVQRPDKARGGAGRKRLSDLHGSVTMRNVSGEAVKRRLEDEAAREAVEQKKRQRLEKRRRTRSARQVSASPLLRGASTAACAVWCRAHMPMEALPSVWAEEQFVQGQGVRGRPQAAAAGL